MKNKGFRLKSPELFSLSNLVQTKTPPQTPKSGVKTLKTQNLTPQVANINKLIGSIINIFKKTINPTISFDRPAERNACSDLIKMFGFEKVEKMAKYAVSVQGEMWAPLITTPWELKNKLAKLAIYCKKRSLINPEQTNSRNTNTRKGKNYDA